MSSSAANDRCAKGKQRTATVIATGIRDQRLHRYPSSVCARASDTIKAMNTIGSLYSSNWLSPQLLYLITVCSITVTFAKCGWPMADVICPTNLAIACSFSSATIRWCVFNQNIPKRAQCTLGLRRMYWRRKTVVQRVVHRIERCILRIKRRSMCTERYILRI
jgi:hypothetical protein